MRVALVLHAFPPVSRTGVETYSEALARALAGQGHEVHVFAPRREERQAYLSQTTEERGSYRVTWLALDRDPDSPELRRARPGVAAAFARFLERERPEVVHFQHLIKLGPGLVDEARERGIATVFTAHDAFAVSNDYTLLAPDLSPLAPGDVEAAARCEQARGILDEAFTAHDGFLPPGSGDEALRARLEQVLHGACADETDLARRVASLRLERDERLSALSRCDRVEAPTAWLAELLRANGLRKRIARRPCGHDIGALCDAAPVEAGHAGPLRALFLGGLYEHKGAHVLLEAAAELGGEVEVLLRGCTGSSEYGRRLARRAAEVGAELGGPFERAELRGLLEAADVVVVPSLWPENAPFVIREAFAAGRPVIASDSAPLRESVRSGTDGVLLPPGDSQALAACLRELASDRGALARLVSGVRAPKGIELDARELTATYAELVAPQREQRARATARLPEHLHGFAAAYEALDALPTQELVRRALAGLEDLASALGEARPDLASALTSASAQRLRERVSDLSRAADWRAEVSRDRERALHALEERVAQLSAAAESEAQRASWHGGLLEEREARLAWTEEQLTERSAVAAELSRAVEHLTRERDWLASEEEARRQELAWTAECLEDRRAHLVEAEKALTDTSAALDAALAEREALRVGLERRETELDTQAAAHGELARAYEELRSSHEAAQQHEAWLRGELRRVLRPLVGSNAGRLETPEEIAPFVARALEELQQLGRELSWRAEEMEAASRDVRGVGERLFHGPLLRRVDSWRRAVDPSGGES
jgi:glycosyltransferase involved in cell wall biosynthesis